MRLFSDWVNFSVKTLSIEPLRTAIFHQGENLVEFLFTHIRTHELEGSILAITSKLLSLDENRTASSKLSKKELIIRESDHYLGEMGYGCHLAIKHGLLVASAGVDVSNSETGDFLLYPEDPFDSAQKLRSELRKRLQLREFGILITDSHTTPLRHGVQGITLAFSGFFPVTNLVGEKDIFGRPLKMTKTNNADALSAAAVLMMGEAAEQRPLALIRNAPVQFTDEDRKMDLVVPVDEDMYKPLYEKFLKK